MEHLIIYNKGTTAYLAQAAILATALGGGGNNVTIKDISALDEAGIDSWVGGLSADTYDSIRVASLVGVSGDYKIGPTQMAGLNDAIKTAAKSTQFATQTATAGGNSTLTYGTGGFGVASAYVGMYLVLTGGTGEGQMLKIASHNDTVLTCDGTWDTNPDTDTTFIIVAGVEVNSVATTMPFYEYDGLTALQAWNAIYPSITAPEILRYLDPSYGAYKVYHNDGTGAATGISDTGAFTGMDLEGDYVFLTATNGNAYPLLWGVIASNTNDAVVLEENWAVAPVGTTGYAICKRPSQLYLSLYYAYFVSTYMYDLNTTEHLNRWVALLDKDRKGTVDYIPAGLPTPQDDVLRAQVRTVGATILDYINALRS